MTFKAGKSGNPAGRPKGIVDKRAELRAILEDHAPAIIGKLIELAKSGDPHAIRLCVERLIPRAVDKDDLESLHQEQDELKKEMLALKNKLDKQYKRDY